MIKVGKIKPGEEKKKYRYPDLPMQGQTWLSVMEYLPKDYDLCHLKTASGKLKSGWFYRDKWDGYKIKPDDIIVQWKLQEIQE